MDFCERLNLLWELPPYLRYLTAHDCTSLEKVSFIDQNRDLYELHSFDEDDFLDDDDGLLMLFSNCFNLNQDSIDNIEANAMLKIGSLVKKCASEYVLDLPSLMCSFPGNKISANKFKFQSMNSSLIFKIDPNVCSGSRLLVFAICFVADLTPSHANIGLKFICEYKLTVASDGDGGGGCENFINEWYELDFEADRQYRGDHVLVLFNRDMVIKDKDYEEASFEFYIKSRGNSLEVPEVDIKVEKCGVHLIFNEMSNDEESYADSDVESSEKSDFNEMSNDESDDSFYSAEDSNFEEVDVDTQKRL
ncbi:hypothetical protein V6N13_122117 [Hibiscus sabdariffa]|uniref:Uncharacterized protein n=2 Tax=Hibiscus sabdariffa TaxID=183260 RepID=A0ABR2C6S4_9ROSI